MSEETPSIAAPEQNAIAETGSITAKTSRGTIHCSPLSARSRATWNFPHRTKPPSTSTSSRRLRQLSKPTKFDGLLVLLNTVGGDVEAGLAIAELIAWAEKADRVARARRRALNRCTAGRCRQKELYCRFRRHDHSSGADEPARSLLCRRHSNIWRKFRSASWISSPRTHTSPPNVCSSLCAKPVS